MNNPRPMEKIQASVGRFVAWLDHYGETSYDHQSFFASDFGRRAKALYYTNPLLGTMAVSPMILCEAFLPSARRLFFKPQRFPIADAHYAMGFAFLSQVLGAEEHYRRAVHFLEVLQTTRCPGFRHYCWGYPFNWETRRGTIKENTPLITTVPYVYEAFREVYQIDHDHKWQVIMHSIATHAVEDYYDRPTSARAATCSYSPGDEGSCGVVNASAYRAFLLTKAAADFCENKWQRIAERNLNFVLESQNPDGLWYYSMDGERDFVDHFHTCFVLKALAKIEAINPTPELTKAIERGVDYYVRHLFDEHGLPKPFSRRPRLTVYRRELYDCAECVNLAVLLRGRFAELDNKLSTLLANLNHWQKKDGSFRSRQLLLGWDDVPMHRWAQSQFFRSLCFLLYCNLQDSNQPQAHHSTQLEPAARG